MVTNYKTARVFLTLTIFIVSCQNKSNESVENIIASFSGKILNIPQNVQPYILGDTTKVPKLQIKPFKILVYTDSAGCTNCQLRLDQWKNFIKEIDSTSGKRVDFQFWFNPKDDDIVPALISAENFRYPVYVDQQDQLNIENNLPKEIWYRCFLLDQNNKVILVGNPTLNPGVKKLYREYTSIN